MQLIESKVETQMPEIDLFAGNAGSVGNTRNTGNTGNGDAE